jgi:hypothetical protein
LVLRLRIFFGPVLGIFVVPMLGIFVVPMLGIFVVPVLGIFVVPVLSILFGPALYILFGTVLLYILFGPGHGTYQREHMESIGLAQVGTWELPAELNERVVVESPDGVFLSEIIGQLHPFISMIIKSIQSPLNRGATSQFGVI